MLFTSIMKFYITILNMFDTVHTLKLLQYTRSIAVVLQVDSDVVLDGVVDKNTSYDFCMCNPPFFQDSMDREGDRSNRTGTRPSPPNPSTSKIADHEMVTKGGEVEFVSRILADSLKLRTKIRCVCVCNCVCVYIQ